MSVYYPNIINPNEQNSGSNVAWSNPMTGALDMGGFQVANSMNGTMPNSLATVGQVNEMIALNTTPTFAPTATSDLNMNYKNITTAKSYGLQPTQPSNPPLILSNQGTGNNLLLAMAKDGGDGMAFVYDTVYNKPPTASFVGTANGQLNMVGNPVVQADYIDFVNQDTFNNGTTGTELRLQARVVNNKPVITIQTGDGVQGLGVVYDTVYNQPPTSGGGGWVGTATSDLNMNKNAITSINYVGFEPNLDNSLPNLTISNTSTAGQRSFGYCELGGANPTKFYDTVYNPPPSGGIAGLTIDTESNLLTYNEQPIMINQYLVPTTTFNFTPSIFQTTNLTGAGAILASCVVSGNFEDLFSHDFIYTFSLNFDSVDDPSVFAFSASYPTDVWINITDAGGQNIVSLNSGQPSFYIRNTFLSFVGGKLYFQAKLTKDIAPVGTSQYFFFTNSLNTNAVGPYTITIAMQSIYDLPSGPTYATVHKLNPSTFQIWDTDTSNPFPVVSNYDLPNGITTIRTGQNGLLIKSYRSGGTTFYTDSIQLVPTKSITPKMYYGCQSGTYLNDPPINFALDIFPIPLTQFTFQWWIFCWGDSNNYITYTASGIADPNANQIYGESANLGRFAGTIVSPTEGAFSCSVSVGGLAITAMPIASSWKWTLTYDITSL